MAKITSFILSAFVLCCLAGVAHGCSCGVGPSPCASLRGSQAVFVGLVTSVTEDKIDFLGREENRSYRMKVFRFTVEESLKGIEEKTVDIATGMGGGDCGYLFEIGERYLVYAHKNEALSTSSTEPYTVIAGGWSLTVPLTASLCSRTRPLKEAADDIELIRARNSGEPEMGIFGRVFDYTPQPGGSISSVGFMSGLKVTAEGENRLYEAITDDDGRYRFRSMKPGVYKVSVFLPKNYEFYGGFRGHDVKTEISTETCGAELNFPTQRQP